MIKYSIRPADLRRHHFEVACRLQNARSQERFRLPSWIPGSYLLREFARHVVDARAELNGESLAMEKIDNSTWLCSGDGGDLTVKMRIYALDQSVRGAYLDTARGFFNGPCVFAVPMGREAERVEVSIEPPTDEAGSQWRVATSMRAQAIDASGFGVYVADDYDELLDHPVEISDFDSIDFAASGVEHRFVLAGKHDTDLERIGADLRQLCEEQLKFFGGKPPFDRYVFLGLAVGNGYGGLEHRASSSLIFNRMDLPKIGEMGIPSSYHRFLALCSHEYFHTWHVKRTKPQAFMPYRLNERNYTRLLWVFEGVTSYYQELFLLRSGLLDRGAFLRRIGELLTRVYRVPGRAVQSISEASFDAWDIQYKPEPNSPNASISYYSKGAAVALALDLTLRSRTDSHLSLDSLVLEAWRRYGMRNEGLTEHGFEALAAEMAGGGLDEFFERSVRGTDELPLPELLSDFGIGLGFRPSGGPADKGGTAQAGDAVEVWLGAVWRAVPMGLELTTVLDGGPLQRAGVNPGDVLIAVDRFQINASNIKARLARYQAGEHASISAFRGDELIEADVELAQPPVDSCFLYPLDDPRPRAAKLRTAWLGE